MTFIEGLILIALLVGVAIGMWFQQDRIGGTRHMRHQRDSARRSCDRARLERDQARAERDEARTLLRQRFAGTHHPAAKPSVPPPTRLQLVKEAVDR